MTSLRNFTQIAGGALALLMVGACANVVAESSHGAGHGDEQKTTHSKKGGHHDDNPRPYDATRDAMFDVDAAFGAAQYSGKKVLLILGANWCHDSRGLAAKFLEPSLAEVLETNFETVLVDVGQRDRNLDVGARFGVPELFGTPTVLILSADGDLLNAETVHDWRTADSKSFDETFAYFSSFATRD